MKTAFLAVLIAILAGCSDLSTQSAANTQQDSSTGGDTTDGSAGGGSGDNRPVIEDFAQECIGTDIGTAFQAVSSSSVDDQAFPPDHLYDGCVNSVRSWSGDKASVVTLDAGSVNQMQGFYLWSTFARIEFLKVETSINGVDWRSEYQSVPTKPLTSSVYYPFVSAGPVRYLRITGDGSQLNSWVNLAEVRWSLAGINVIGESVNLKDEISFGSAQPSQATLGTYDLGNPLLNMTDTAAFAVNYVSFYCGAYPTETWDITGHGTQYFEKHESAGVDVYLVDWNHYNGDDSYPFSVGPAPAQLDELRADFWESHGSENEGQENCQDHFNDGFSVSNMWLSYQNGFLEPMSTGFR